MDKRTLFGILRRKLLYHGGWRWMQYDYHPPGLEDLPPKTESWFPHVVKCRSWNPYVPHWGRKDRRWPFIGVLTWEESILVYNYAKSLRKMPFLEIGAWIGWSTALLAYAGTRLTSIDPIHGETLQGKSCTDSLARVNVAGEFCLINGFSPAAVKEIASNGKQFSGFLIDGEHAGDAPLKDAQQCAQCASTECVIILHDAAQPGVGNALRWLQSNGWDCGVHLTAQCLGVATRGGVKLLHHTADPQVDWKRYVERQAPHLRDFL